MSKLGNFLKETSEISNKDRLVICAGTLGLVVMTQVLNLKLFKSRMECINKDKEIDILTDKVNEFEKGEIEREICEDVIEE